MFTTFYIITASLSGFLYKNELLFQSIENGNTVYSGQIHDIPASFTVYADKSVEFQFGDELYGPYTITEEPSAMPKSTKFEQSVTGIELRLKDSVVFRGSILYTYNGKISTLYNEDGSIREYNNYIFEANKEVAIDKTGNIISNMQPNIYTILTLMNNPKLTHNGDWSMWFLGTFICIVTVIRILFADELFRFRLQFQIRDAEYAEPTALEVAGRYFSYALTLIAALIIFITGLC